MNKTKSLTRLSVLGILFNLILLILKLIVGFLTGNQTMLADGFNSAGDVLSSLLTYLGNKFSSVPNDEDHPYGHGKAEYIFSLAIGLILLFVSFGIFRRSLNSLIFREEFTYSMYLSLVALLTIIVKICLYIYANYVYKKFNSLLALANATDHKNDVFITMLTFVSIIAGYYNLYFIDGIGGMLISLWLSYSSYKIMISAYHILMDKNIDNELKSHFAKLIDEIDGLDHLDDIISRPTGLGFILIVKISVDANMTVYKSHAITKEIKSILLKEENVVDVIVHVNPAQFHTYKMKY